MKTNLNECTGLLEAIKNRKLVFMFGSGMSAALTHQPGGWLRWILDGAEHIEYETIRNRITESVKSDTSAENMIRMVGQVISETKRSKTYDAWMKQSLETNDVEDVLLSKTLKLLVAAKAVFLTTNYDLLLEQAADLQTLSYAEPDECFRMLEQNQNNAVIHIHGVYDSENNIDSIIADEDQYRAIISDEAAQFIQNLLSTRTLILVGCGQTTDDVNISRFVSFAREKLKLDTKYYFITKDSQAPEDLPEQFEIVSYGTEYEDLPQFLSDIAEACIKERIENNPMVLRSAFTNKDADVYGLSEYHFSREYVAFCGRRRELAALRAFAECDKRICWWALTGQGGSGKSRLAYEFIKQIASQYLAFFLNYQVDDAYIDAFIPEYDTFIVIDYVLYHEPEIAAKVSKLIDKFESSSASLRILFVDRDNEDITGSWYQRLYDSFDRIERGRFLSCEYNKNTSAARHSFLNLKDMSEEDVSLFIGRVCELKGLPDDPERNAQLREEYGKKFELLRFRPLFVQMYVESWIDNGCIEIDCRNSEDLVKAILRKEQEKLFDAVDRDYALLNAVYRLLIRSSVTDGLAVSDIPAEYEDDWAAVERFISSHAVMGDQQAEYLKTFLHIITDGVESHKASVHPAYPDVIKEALFIFYTDEDTKTMIGHELWEHEPQAFLSFLDRALIDFPQSESLRAYVRKETKDTDNSYILESRVAILKNTVVHDVSEGIILNEILDEEYAFWRVLSVDEDSSSDLKLVKLKGLNRCLTMFYGWSREKETYEVLDAVTNYQGDSACTEWKIGALLEHAAYFDRRGISQPLAQRILKNISAIIENDAAVALSSAVLNKLKRYRIVNMIHCNQDDNAMKEVDEWQDSLDVTDMDEVEAFAETCFECTQASDSILKGSNMCSYSFMLDDYAQTWAEDPDGYAFNDRIHYYYLRSKYIRTIRVLKNTQIIGHMEAAGIEWLNQLMSEIEGNLMIDEFSGILVGCYMHKLSDDTIHSSDDVDRYIQHAEELMEKYPNNSFLAANLAGLYTAAYRQVYKRRIPTDIVRRLYVLYLRFPEDDYVQDAFYAMFLESDELCRWRDYFERKSILTCLIGSEKFSYIEGFREAAASYVRKNVKVNDPCPCGSGKKYKKCCKLTGAYE
ncbi:MAG: SIR2 family protein [Ruminococcus sp.]|nr:SIR2 family protein [Ruminococcus sp.]